MTKSDEKLENLSDFSEEQLQEREHHFLKKMWVSAGIIIAVLIALSASTFAVFSTTKSITVKEKLSAKVFSVETELSFDGGVVANSSLDLEKKVCDIGYYKIGNDDEYPNKTFQLSIIPTGTVGVQGYCKILVNGTPFYIIVDIKEQEQAGNIKTLDIVLGPETTATIEVEFSWATLNDSIEPKLTEHNLICVTAEKGVFIKEKNDSLATVRQTLNPEDETPADETMDEITTSEEDEEKYQEIPEDEEITDETETPIEEEQESAETSGEEEPESAETPEGEVTE